MVEARDRNGKTESEFLRDYDVTKYFRPSVTVDAVLYCRMPDALKILMVERGGHPFIGKYAFPGGFVESDESCEAAVVRELREETGIVDVPLRQLLAASEPGRDPRWRNITVVFCGEVKELAEATAGDDAANAKWFDVRCADGIVKFSGDGESFSCKLDIVRDAFGKLDLNATEISDRGKTAFDHAKIAYYLTEEVISGKGTARR